MTGTGGKHQQDALEVHAIQQTRSKRPVEAPDGSLEIGIQSHPDQTIAQPADRQRLRRHPRRFPVPYDISRQWR
jgi:hypothetical protein